MNTTQTYGLAMIAITAVMLLSSELRLAIVRPVSAAPASATTQYPFHARQAAALAGASSYAVPQGGQGYGLIQQGIVGVSHMDATGQFGAPTAMPLYQIIRIQAPRQVAANHSAQNYGSVAARPRRAPLIQRAPDGSNAETLPGISVQAPTAAAAAPTRCKINDVSLLTPSAQACAKAGGEVVTQAY